MRYRRLFPAPSDRASGRRTFATRLLVTVVLLGAWQSRAQVPRLNLTGNSGFEKLVDGKPVDWRIADNMSSITTEHAHTGKRSLKINDTEPTKGSSLFSPTFKVIDRRNYYLRAWVKLDTGTPSGLGLYVRFNDADGKEIKNSEGRQQIASPKMVQDQWVPVFFKARVPDGAKTVQLWVHTFNAAVLTCCVDDLQLLECFEGAWGEAENWSGGIPDEFMTKDGAFSVRWAQGESSSLTKTFEPAADWSKYSGLSFWLHANKAANSAFMLILVSENPQTEGMDYWSKKIVADWQGWQQFVFSFGELDRSRKPIGWNHLEKVYLTASGWGNTPDPGLVIHVAALRPVVEVVQ